MISSWKPRANRKHTGRPGHLQADLARLSLSRCGGKDGLLSGIFFLNSQVIKSYKYYQISGDIFGMSVPNFSTIWNGRQQVWFIFIFPEGYVSDLKKARSLNASGFLFFLQ